MEEKLKVIIDADSKNLQKEMKKGKDSVSDFKEETEEASSAIDELARAAGDAVKNAFTKISTAVLGITATMTGIAESTREYRQEQDKLVTAFESAGGSAETAKKTYDDLFRVLGEEDTAVEAANHLAKLTTKQEDLAEWTEICQGVYATFGKSLPIEGLTEAANETAQVGKVTGVLADAINWAGESEDEFNEELSKCTTSQQREEKIRKKLNDLYKKASREYETTAKKTLKANEAQGKLNDAMATAGKDMQPVSDALKDLGATALQEFREPLKKASNVIVKDVIPAMKNMVGWASDNIPTIAATLSIAVVALTGYKVAIGLAALEAQGLTIATAAQAAAQKVLNAVMNANPYVLVGTALAAITAGAVAYAVAARDAGVDTGYLTEKEQEVIARSKEAADEFVNLQNTLKENSSGIVTTFEHTQDLADELKTLADENGKVQDSDRARVDFILGELNEALGTEYRMVDGVIQQYGDLKKNIDEVIASKRANSLLEAYNEEYITAIKNEKDAYNALVSSQKEYDAIGQQLKILEAEKQEAFDNYVLAKESGDERTIESARIALEKATTAWGNEAALYAEKGKALEEVEGNYENVKVSIEKYEKASEEALKGNYEAAEEYLNMTTDEFLAATGKMVDSSGELVEEIDKNAGKISTAASKGKENFIKGMSGFTGKALEEASKSSQTIIDEFSKKKADAESAGKDLTSGLQSGMNSGSGLLALNAANLVNNALAAMKQAAGIQSPSKITKGFGKYIDEGLAIGIDNNTDDVIKSAKKMINKTLAPIETNVSVRDLNITQPSTIGIANNLKMPKQEAKNTPVILQVDGKTFAETAIDTINQLTRQSGKLALRIY